MLIWKDPCFWEEIVLLWVDSTHAHQVPCKVVFARDTVDPWVHVYLLIRQHFLQEIRSDRQVVPAEVPHRRKLLPSDSVDDSPIMVLLVVLHPEVTNFAAHFFYDFVFCLSTVHHEPFFLISPGKELSLLLPSSASIYGCSSCSTRVSFTGSVFFVI